MIKLTNINKTYKKKQVLKDLNLHIDKGQIIGLLAPNGEGKTTLFKILVGLIQDFDGNYDFEGESFNYKLKNKIGYMCDEEILPKNWYVISAVDYYNKYFNTFNKEKCLKMLENFKINTDDKIKNLSKGNREKVHLSLALSIDAKIYILDEPLASVDVIAREEILKAIIENFNEDSTILLSSHLINDFENILDKVLFLKNGQIPLEKYVDDIREEGKSLVDYYKEVYGA